MYYEYDKEQYVTLPYRFVFKAAQQIKLIIQLELYFINILVIIRQYTCKTRINIYTNISYCETKGLLYSQNMSL